MNRLRFFIQCFLAVTTGIVILCAVLYPNNPEALTPNTLWQILLSAGLCALSTALFYPGENASTLRIGLGLGLHFVSLCVIMVICGRWFGWIGNSFLAGTVMVGYVILVYGFVTGTNYLLERKQAKELNRKLKEKYPQEQEISEKQ